jgi:hypothetical protein
MKGNRKVACLSDSLIWGRKMPHDGGSIAWHGKGQTGGMERPISPAYSESGKGEEES